MGHWILVTLYRKNKVLGGCEVFDSLGRSKMATPIQLCDYIRQLNVSITYSNVQIQSYTSDFCGLFCVARFFYQLLMVKIRQNSEVTLI